MVDAANPLFLRGWRTWLSGVESADEIDSRPNLWSG